MVKNLFSLVFNMSITASMVICAVIALRIILRKSPKIYSYMLWSVVLYRLLCPYSIPLEISAFNFLPPAQTKNGQITYTVPENVIDIAVNSDTVADNSNNIDFSGSENADIYVNQNDFTKNKNISIDNSPKENQIIVSRSQKPDIKGFFAGIWILGVIYIVCNNVLSLQDTKNILTQSNHIEDNIYENRYIPTAFITGFIKPRIYIPDSLNDEQKKYIISHEKVHIKRKDYIFKLLAFIALCLHWFNPLVWIAFHLAEKDMEMSCDEAVIKNLNKAGKVAYSTTLLNISSPSVSSKSAIAFSEGDTKNRVKNVLEFIKPSVKYILTVSFVIIIAGIMLITNPVNSVYKTITGDFSPEECVILYSDGYMRIEKDLYTEFSKGLKKIKISDDNSDKPTEISHGYTFAFFQDMAIEKAYFDREAKYMTKESEDEAVVYTVEDSEKLMALFDDILSEERISYKKLNLTYPAFNTPFSLEIAEKYITPFDIEFTLPQNWSVHEGYTTPYPELISRQDIYDENNNLVGYLNLYTCETGIENVQRQFESWEGAGTYDNFTIIYNEEHYGILKASYSGQINSNLLFINSYNLNSFMVISLYDPYYTEDIFTVIADSIVISPCENYNELQQDYRIKFYVKPDENEESIAHCAAEQFKNTMDKDYRYDLSDIKTEDISGLKLSQNIDFKYYITATYDVYDNVNNNYLSEHSVVLLVDEYESESGENYVINHYSNTTFTKSMPVCNIEQVETERIARTPYITQTIKDDTMNLGTSKTVEKGEKGLAKEKVVLNMVNGIIIDETVTESIVIKESKDEVIHQGTLWGGAIISGGSGKLIWPTDGGRVSRGFTGQYPAHNGIDIAGPVGTFIYAADDGVVTKALYTNRGYGVYIEIEHGGYQTLYGQCSELLVSVGEEVKRGQIIAYMGSTGNSTGPHLHFEVKKGNHRYDPYKWL